MDSEPDQRAAPEAKLLHPQLVERDDEGKVFLLGSVCDRCGHASFPALEYCPSCEGDVALRRLGCGGRVYAQTVVRIKPPFGLPRPYRAAFVDLDDAGLRVFALLDPEESAGFSIGDRVSADIGAMGQDGEGAPASRLFFRKTRE